jgi:hypothetical protein
MLREQGDITSYYQYTTEVGEAYDLTHDLCHDSWRMMHELQI